VQGVREEEEEEEEEEERKRKRRFTLFSLNFCVIFLLVHNAVQTNQPPQKNEVEKTIQAFNLLKVSPVGWKDVY